MLSNRLALVRWILWLPLLLSVGISRAQDGNQRILLISDRGGAPQLYVMNADGTGLELFVEGDLEEDGILTSASLSPNGTLLAFSSFRDRGGDPRDQIFLMDMRTGIITQITDAPKNATLPVWSPDSSRFAYFTGSGMNGYSDVHIFDVVNPQDYVVIGGDELRDTIHNDFSPSTRQMDWSPDGRQMILSIQTSPPEAYNVLILLNSDGTDPQQITPNEMSISEPIWRYEPNSIYVTCNYAESDAIYRLNLETGEIQVLFNLIILSRHERSLRVKYMDVSASDELIFQPVGSNSIYLFEASNHNLTRLSEGSTGRDTLLGWIYSPPA